MVISKVVRSYVRTVAKEHIEGNEDDYEAITELRDNLWDTMTTDEKDQANEIVIAVFDPWILGSDDEEDVIQSA